MSYTDTYPQAEFAFVCGRDSEGWLLRVDGKTVRYPFIPTWHCEGKFNKFLHKRHLPDNPER